jgi:hypothetical protein
MTDLRPSRRGSSAGSACRRSSAGFPALVLQQDSLWDQLATILPREFPILMRVDTTQEPSRGHPTEELDARCSHMSNKRRGRIAQNFCEKLPRMGVREFVSRKYVREWILPKNLCGRTQPLANECIVSNDTMSDGNRES